MRLWHVFRTDVPGYDETVESVVRAETEQQARELVSQKSGDEGADFWLGDKVRCEPVEANGEAKVVVTSFNSG